MNDLNPPPVARSFGGGHLTRLLVRRIAFALILLMAATLVLFFGIEALPGDFASTYLGQSATPQAIANIRRSLGLDRPAPERYIEWASGVLHGDFGLSWASHTPVAEQLTARLSNSLRLAAGAAVIAVPLAVLLGLVCVRFHNRMPDRLIGLLTLVTIALPEFFVGYLLINYVVVKLGWFAFPATVYDGMPLANRLSAMALPMATLVLAVLAQTMRMTRTAILNVMEAPYIETARLKGLPAFAIIARHAAPNAVAPIMTVISLTLAALVVGVVVIEVIFVYPGIGQYMVDAVTVRDMPVVLACGLVFAAIYIFLNLFADVVAILANPRLRHPR